MSSYFLRFLILFLTVSHPRFVLAAEMTGIGDIAESLIAPVGIISDFISAAAIVISIACLFGAFVRFHQFRVNPFAAPLSSVITLFILGLVLLCFPLLRMIAGENFGF